jgi:SRSO17 transposase
MAQRPKKGDAHGSKPGGRLAAVAERFFSFMNSYADHFRVHLKSQASNASAYLKGITTKNLKKNMERMSEADSKRTSDPMQHFITDSPWPYREVMDHVACDTSAAIGDEYAAGLIVDESGIVKKGDQSVGVARQWIGNIGKVENGQVGVYGSLVNGSYRSIIDARLYLPKEWTSSKRRLDKAKVPETERSFKTKETIALEIVKNAIELGLKFGWAGGDAGYGKNLYFAFEVELLNKVFLIDVHKDQLIYLKEPQFQIPEYSGRGRKPTKTKPVIEPIRVDAWAESQPQECWQRTKVRIGTKGPVEYEYLTVRIWVYDLEYGIRQWHLIVRRDPETKSDYKYSLSNAPESTPLERLAYMQAQRYWVERSFEDAKQDFGMADYQVRTWPGWHHHMAMVMMAMVFLLMEKIENQQETPLLTGRDVNELLTFYLYKESPSEEEIYRRMATRHRKRQRDIENRGRRRTKSFVNT